MFIVIFSDGLVCVKILEYFNLLLDQFQCAELLILSDVPYIGFNEASVDLFSTDYHFLSRMLNKEIEHNTCDFLLLFCIATKYMVKTNN